MKSIDIVKLEERNQRIIKAVITKMEKVCSGSVALIGIGGSFCSGDIHAKSDLDLLIIITDDKAQELSSCFILDDVGFDIYCSEWNRLEQMAEYKNPYCGKLIDLKIVYVLNQETEDRYFKLQNKLKEKLSQPLSENDIEKAKSYLTQAESEYIEIMINDEMAKCRYSSALVLYYLEFSLYMINKKYVKYGIKRIPQEISEMSILPDGFIELHNKIVCSETISEIKMYCTELIKIMRQCFKNIEKNTQIKKDINAENLIGTYEEIYSNWRNKMYHSIEIANPYLSFSTIASCQNFYNMMSDRFNICNINVIRDFTPSDLAETAACFDMAMDEYLKLYKKLNVKVVNYETIDEFEKNYLM